MSDVTTDLLASAETMRGKIATLRAENENLKTQLIKEQARFDYILDEGLTIEEHWRKLDGREAVWAVIHFGFDCFCFLAQPLWKDRHRIWRKSIDVLLRRRRAAKALSELEMREAELRRQRDEIVKAMNHVPVQWVVSNESPYTVHLDETTTKMIEAILAPFKEKSEGL